MIQKPDIQRYIDKHGEAVVAQCLNIIIDHQLFEFYFDLDRDVFFCKQFPDPIEAIEEATGSAW